MCKYILNLISSKFSRKVDTKYFFLRWLVKLLQSSSEAFEVVATIHKLATESQTAAARTLFDFADDLFCIDNKLFIVTSRPGYIIGNDGNLIDEIIKISDKDIVIIESMVDFTKAIYYQAYWHYDECGAKL